MSLAEDSHSSDRCWAVIDLDALQHNAAVLRERAGREIMAIVKANAYGHGAAEVARALDESVEMFGVANVPEAEQLRAAGVTRPVLLLGACLPAEREAALVGGFEVAVSSLEEAAEWDALAKSHHHRVQAHVVIDTGMGRMGFPEEIWDIEVAKSLTKLTQIEWTGFSSHLPSADEDERFTKEQITRFRACVSIAHDAGLSPRWIHLANSAGVLGFDTTCGLCNLARPGLALYGVSPLPELQSLLKPALTWKSHVILVRELSSGHGISYGSTLTLTRKTKVATLACGYADGYPRQVSNKGASVLIDGHRCPLLGRVTMDQIMVDVTDVPDAVAPGDEAILLGEQGTEAVSANEIARWADTIPWHVFTSITARVQRNVSSGQKERAGDACPQQ